MQDLKTGGRKLRQTILGLLKSDDWEGCLHELSLLEPRRAINALISLFCSPEETIRWRAITSAAAAVAILAENDREAARVIMRRLVWSLNDESGGIGWGAPEAMAEIMARDEVLAREYSRIFVSYLDEKGNFLEYEALQQGLLWGLTRLALVRPELLQEAIPHLRRYLESGNAAVRGLAARAAGLLGAQEFYAGLRSMLNDKAEFALYDEGKVVLPRAVKDLAEEALKALESQRHAIDGKHRQTIGP